jgi:hypothetical protein
MKACTKCRRMLSGAMYFRDKHASDGLVSRCKDCISAYRHEYVARPGVAEMATARVMKYYTRNREDRKLYNSVWNRLNRNKRQKYNKEYWMRNKRRLMLNHARWEADRCRRDPKFRLRKKIQVLIATRLRNRLSEKGGVPTFSFLPYTLDELMLHLESRFRQGMSWENYGRWQIDHIRPDCAFEYTNPTDDGFQECWSLDNLQPLWAIENMQKGGRL